MIGLLFIVNSNFCVIKHSLKMIFIFGEIQIPIICIKFKNQANSFLYVTIRQKYRNQSEILIWFCIHVTLYANNQELKGYLHYKSYLNYKTITSQNVLFEAQVKNFFILWRCYAPFSRYSSFCIFNHRTIYQICDVMSIST